MSNHDIIWLESVDSTNEYIKKRQSLWKKHLLTVVANTQTSGRGRYTRKWHSESGRDLTFSTVITSAIPVEHISCVTLLAGLSVYRALHQYLGYSLNLKWPNDIRCGNRKIGGILSELVTGDGMHSVITGIGLNINSREFPKDIEDRASSLILLTGKELDRKQILRDILAELGDLLKQFTVPLQEHILIEWTQASSSIGADILYMQNQQKLEGTIEGVNGNGSLQISGQRGVKIQEYRGEILYLDEA